MNRTFIEDFITSVHETKQIFFVHRGKQDAMQKENKNKNKTS